MTTYLVDTNILINALNDKRGHRELLNQLVDRGHRLACCTVILSELFSGIKPPDLPNVEQFISLLTWYAATPAIARHAGRLRFDYARKGVALSLPDVLIAATALEHGLTLITDNRKQFPLPELSVYPLPGATA
jgi:predicted nucleic acid-binding protein